MALEIITADALTPFRHGFFTRKGGASSGIFQGLNCGFGSSDQAQVVEINRSRVVHALGGTSEDLATVHQCHTARAVTVTRDSVQTREEADAVVTQEPGLVLMILTADCAPVLFADAKAGVVGAAHAGWRGAIGGILEATIEAMESLGADRSTTKAVVGPTISQKAYEVGPEFRERFLDASGANGRFFVAGQREGKFQFDLPCFAKNILRDAGVAHVEWSQHCTYSDPERFFSYRRSVHDAEPDYGRLASAIRI
ncbi:MAG: peptidoglycan editing factor PgeF [Pseudomonadota bacterium]